MRRSLAAAVAALSLTAPLLPTVATYADDRSPAAEGRTGPDAVLARAVDALEGESPAAARPHDVTLALRDLFAVLPRLRGDERRRAEGLLARPTDGANDLQGDGYRARAVRTCNRRLCVHRVRRTSDRATRAWAERTLETMNRVWKREIGGLDYRRPPRDRRRGGNRKFDVYLADVGARGVYGYCAPERTRPDYPRVASGYCVLDNDFARDQFGARPAVSLRATAAHEFFHAIQFGYDWREDRWLMEATATWMEERVFDGVDDNRQYVPYGQLGRPQKPLDTSDPYGNDLSPYGNWPFFEYLHGRFGAAVVRRTWQQAGHHEGGGAMYSTEALAAALPDRTSFQRAYAGFTAANVTPADSYAEGDQWQVSPRHRTHALGPGARVQDRLTVDHMAARVVRLRPRAGLNEPGWRLRIRVSGPRLASDPTVTVVRQTASGAVRRSRLRLDGSSEGIATVPFSTGRTRRVWLVLANASTRFVCGRQTGFSCRGRPRDDNREFDVTFRTVSG